MAISNGNNKTFFSWSNFRRDWSVDFNTAIDKNSLSIYVLKHSNRLFVVGITNTNYCYSTRSSVVMIKLDQLLFAWLRIVSLALISPFFSIFLQQNIKSKRFFETCVHGAEGAIVTDAHTRCLFPMRTQFHKL